MLATLHVVHCIPADASSVLQHRPELIDDEFSERRQSDRAPLDGAFNPCRKWVPFQVHARGGIPADMWRPSHLSRLDDLRLPGELDQPVRGEGPHRPTVRIGRRSVWSFGPHDGRLLRREGGKQQDPAGAPTQTETSNLSHRGTTAIEWACSI